MVLDILLHFLPPNITVGLIHYDGQIHEFTQAVYKHTHRPSLCRLVLFTMSPIMLSSLPPVNSAPPIDTTFGAILIATFLALAWVQYLTGCMARH